MTVAASEFYNTALEAEVTTRVGGTFADAGRVGRKRPVRELVGVDARLNTPWSSRRRAIDTVTAELSARFVTDHGRVPTTVESLRLRAAGHPGHPGPQTRTPVPGRATHRMAAAGPGGPRRETEPRRDGRHRHRRPAGTRRGGGRDRCSEDLAAADRRRPWRRIGRSGGNPTCYAEALRVIRPPVSPTQRRSDAGRGRPSPRRVVAGGRFVADRDGHRDRPAHPPRRTGCAGSDGESVYRVAKAQLYTHPRCWTPSRGSSPPPAAPTGGGSAPRMSSWRSWNGRRTPAAGC